MTAPTSTPSKKFSRQWEMVSSACWRLQVAGGWLVKTVEEQRNNTLVFVPDPAWDWIFKANE